MKGKILLFAVSLFWTTGDCGAISLGLVKAIEKRVEKLDRQVEQVKIQPSPASEVNPKITSYWTSPVMSNEQAMELAKCSLVIADMENMINNYSSLQLLKQLNPKIKLLTYSNPMEFFVPMVANRPLQKKLLEKVQQNYSQWFLKQPDGQPVVFWQGMQMLNLSSLCPVINDQRWNQYVANFLLENVLSDSIWDGYFMDNSGGNISWVNGGQIDADNNGVKDDSAVLDQAWSNGIREFLTTIRQAKGQSFIIVGNKGSVEFLDILNGKMFEEFPNDYLGGTEAGGWYQSMENCSRTGPYSVIQSEAKGESWRLYVLASALLAGSYFAYGQNTTSWFSEYQDIGSALGSLVKKDDGSWQREFAKATVIVWPNEKIGQIIYK